MGHPDDGLLYYDGQPAHTSQYLWAPVLARVQESLRERPTARVLDLGCGNGAFAVRLALAGIDVVGVDPSPSAVAQAHRAHPGLKVYEGSGYDDLTSLHGHFQVVTCLEVIEHCFSPRQIARSIWSLLEPGGTALLSTPYHGYWKNLALALTGRMDAHYTALWDHGHIKFWSVRTITALCNEAGLDVVAVERLGRLPPLAKSMVVVARKTERAGRGP